ncbi:hypothetical protein JTL74_34735, partial [Pseudomonas aeruginosa]|nr:hypothetical protein [Pseudomonas aeruginosa]
QSSDAELCRWIRFELTIESPLLMVQAPLKLLQVGRQAPTNVRIVPEFPPGDLSYFAYGSVAVVGGLAQQLHVVGVQLQGFCRGYRFVVEDVDVA